ncbi:Transcription factor TFIIIB component B [Dissophora globulifera]|nr:Transcription factor TFIIIB component B [Dissophora globulifera]
MSGISIRIDKSQTRYAPKLKARPNRNRAAASEDGTPAPTPSIGSSTDSATMGALLLEESELGQQHQSTTNTSASHGDINGNHSGSATSTATPSVKPVSKESSSRRMSTTASATATPMIPPRPPQPASSTSSQDHTVMSSPRSPTITPTHVIEKSTSATVLASSIPSHHRTSVLEPPSSSSSAALSSTVISPTSATGLTRTAVAVISPSVTSSSPASISSPVPARSNKGASIISAPTARGRLEPEEVEEDELEEEDDDHHGISIPSSSSARKRNRGKPIRSRNAVDDVSADGEMEVGGEEALPDYANMYMYEFVKDMGVGKRSKVFMEQQKMFRDQRKVNKKEERIRAIRRMEGRGPSPPPTLSGEEDNEENNGEEEDELMDEYDDEQGERKRAKSEVKTPVQAAPPATKTFAPQVRVIEGRIELDIDSLTVDHAVVEAAEHQGAMEYVEESSSTKFVNSSTYSRKITSERWTEQETELFYEAISQWGTDFGIICRLFPSKTRVAVRNKYKREDRYNHSRVEAALNNRAPIDLDKYSQMTKMEFPEVSELDAIKAPLDDDLDDQQLLMEAGFEEEDEAILQGVEDQYEEGGEEIVGHVGEFAD